jgi:hypothetical protein
MTIGDQGGSWTELVCCGHPPPLLLRGGSATFIEPCPAPPLGLLDLADGWCQSSRFGVGEGEQLLLYTDGVSEARDAAGRFFPLAERTTRALARTGSADGGPELLDELVANLADHVSGRMRDDVLLLLASIRLAADGQGLAQLGQQGRFCEGLLDEVDAVLEDALGVQDAMAVAGHEQHAGGRT